MAYLSGKFKIKDDQAVDAQCFLSDTCWCHDSPTDQTKINSAMIRWPVLYSQTHCLQAGEFSAGENKDKIRNSLMQSVIFFKECASLAWCKQKALPAWGTMNQEDKFYWRERKGFQLNHSLFHEGKNSKTQHQINQGLKL